jgi:hypothetical protein
MNLGTLIRLLEQRPADGTVQFEFGGLTPGYFSSWRMNPAELCLTHDGKWPKTTGALLAQARGANGHTFEGWKGGDYLMNAETEVWVANAGEPGGASYPYYTAILGIGEGNDDDTVIHTGRAVQR